MIQAGRADGGMRRDIFQKNGKLKMNKIFGPDKMFRALFMPFSRLRNILEPSEISGTCSVGQFAFILAVREICRDKEVSAGKRA